MRKRVSLLIGAILVSTVLLVETVRAIPIITLIPEGQAGVMQCEGGIPDPRISADKQSVILICHSPAASIKTK